VLEIEKVSITKFWEWIQVPTNLAMDGQLPTVSGFKSLRGKIVYARVSYDDHVFRVIGSLDDNHLLVIKVACERTIFAGVEGVEGLRCQLQKLLCDKIHVENKRRSALLAAI